MADLEGTRAIEIAAPPERCFAIAADLDRVPEWHGAMTHVEVLERDSERRAIVVDSEMDAMVARVRVRLRFSYDKPVGLRWTRESGDLRSLKGSWRFQERGPRGRKRSCPCSAGILSIRESCLVARTSLLRLPERSDAG